MTAWETQALLQARGRRRTLGSLPGRSSRVLFAYRTPFSLILLNHFLKFVLMWTLLKVIYVFMAALGLHCYSGFLRLQRARVTFHCSLLASHRSGFSCCGAQTLGSQASVVSACRFSSCSSQALELRLNSCGPWAYLLLGIMMWTIFKVFIEFVTILFLFYILDFWL